MQTSKPPCKPVQTSKPPCKPVQTSKPPCKPVQTLIINFAHKILSNEHVIKFIGHRIHLVRMTSEVVTLQNNF